MGRVLDDVVALDPDRTALIIGGVATSYAALEQAIASAAAGLAAAGVERGVRIPLVDDASVLAVAALIGATRVGASTALMNPRLTGGELAVLMQAAATASTGVVGAGYAVGRAERRGSTPLLGAGELLDGPWTAAGEPDRARSR